MKRTLRFLALPLVVVVVGVAAAAQEPASPAAAQPGQFQIGVDLMSRTDGAEVGPYLRVLLSDLRKHWMPLAQASGSTSVTEQEETVLALTIAPDGRLLAMRVESSTADKVLREAAWTAMKEATVLPLPAGMSEPNLKLRIHFTVG